MRVNAELQDSWLERLNAIPEVEICSTCCGQPDGVGMGLGGLKSPTFSFKLRNRDEAEGKAIVRVFRLNPLLMSFANVQVWSDAELDAKDLNELFSECQLTFKSGSVVMEERRAPQRQDPAPPGARRPDQPDNDLHHLQDREHPHQRGEDSQMVGWEHRRAGAVQIQQAQAMTKRTCIIAAGGIVGA